VSVTVLLACRARSCVATATVEPSFKLTRWGYLRVEGGAGGWMVDGNGALCPSHVPNLLPSPQRETWSDVDRAHVINDLEVEGWTVEEPR
jgi:hypothetical protein